MKRLAAILISLLPLGACGDVVKGIGAAAESTRDAAEHAAVNQQAFNDAKEALIQEQAADPGEALAVATGDRFYLRAEGQGWSVVDRSTDKAGSIAGQRLSNMRREDALEALEHLREDADRN